jgi:arylsulfatase A-like enzyme
VGWALGGRELGLSLDETTLPEVVGAQYETALVGKWHLGETEATGGTSSPNEHGWGHYNGVLSGALPDYYAWREVENGVEKGINNEYALSWKVDRAIEWTAAQEAPWLLVLALNAPHKPFHAPDPSLHGLALDTPIGDECPRNEQVACYTAMVEAADTEIGRLLDVVDLDDTTVVVMGDNGTPKEAVLDPFTRRHAKGTTYEGGVRVPLVVSGAAVRNPGRVEGDLVQTLDLFTTIVELTGGDASAGIDARSLVPYLEDREPDEAREWLFTERFADQDPSLADVAIRGPRYSVIRDNGEPAQCFDLDIDIDNTDDLNEGDPPARCAELEALIATIREAQ